MSRVLVVQRRMTHYRVPFFNALREALQARACELVVAYGEGTASERVKNDAAELPWGQRLSTRYAWGGRLCWQPFGHLLAGADAVVITAENKLLYNLWVQQRCASRVLLWGHGGNLQGNPHSLRERFKRRMARQADWWLAYTEHSRGLVEACGFPAERITVLDNAVDTRELARQRAAVSEGRLAALRQRLGLQAGPVGIYVGSLYAEKRIDFLLDAARALRQRVPQFQLLLLGGGELAGLVQEFCAAHDWAHYLGVTKGQDKVDAMALADVMLNPGALGLGVIDSFVCGVPLVTLADGRHGPEIAYLQHGANGLVVQAEQSAFVTAAISVLDDEHLSVQLKQGCSEAAARYTIENMAENFATGVLACLGASPRRAAAMGAAG